jgi:hypothetical protein
MSQHKLAAPYRRTPVTTAYDAIVIGSGIGGLATAARRRLNSAADLIPAGLGFDVDASTCAGLGVASLDTVADLATCLTRALACRVDQMLDVQTPRTEGLVELGGVNLPERPPGRLDLVSVVTARPHTSRRSGWCRPSSTTCPTSAGALPHRCCSPASASFGPATINVSPSCTRSSGVGTRTSVLPSPALRRMNTIWTP